MALDASERVAYVITVFVSILSAAVISYQHQAPGYSLIAIFVYGLAGVYGVFKLNAQELGWIETKVPLFRWQLRRSTILTAILILLVDGLLLGLSIASSDPRFRF